MKAKKLIKFLDISIRIHGSDKKLTLSHLRNLIAKAYNQPPLQTYYEASKNPYRELDHDARINFHLLVAYSMMAESEDIQRTYKKFKKRYESLDKTRT